MLVFPLLDLLKSQQQQQQVDQRIRIHLHFRANTLQNREQDGWMDRDRQPEIETPWQIMAQTPTTPTSSSSSSEVKVQRERDVAFQRLIHFPPSSSPFPTPLLSFPILCGAVGMETSIDNVKDVMLCSAFTVELS